jgi:hypothetical protein
VKFVVPQSAIATSLSEKNSHDAETGRLLLLPQNSFLGERYSRADATYAHPARKLKTVSPRVRGNSNQDKQLGLEPA